MKVFHWKSKGVDPYDVYLGEDGRPVAPNALTGHEVVEKDVDLIGSDSDIAAARAKADEHARAIREAYLQKKQIELIEAGLE